MTNFLLLKEKIKTLYSKYQVYVNPLAKFLLALITLALINGTLGYMSRLNNFAIVLIVALMCSFLPMGLTIVIMAGFVLGHFYAIGLECAAVGLAVFLLLFILYFRFSPKDTLVVMLLPVCFMLKIPYLIPIVMGLIGTPFSVVSVSCGVIVYYLIQHVDEIASVFSTMETASMLEKFRLVVDGIVANKAMYVTLVAFAITVLMVYLIRRMSIDHSWTIAMVAGGFTGVVIMLIGDLAFETNLSVIITLLGGIISVCLAKVLQFFVFNVDYSRVEKVQFEDDEYYYYVKAVPKITVSASKKEVRKINSKTPEAK